MATVKSSLPPRRMSHPLRLVADNGEAIAKFEAPAKMRITNVRAYTPDPAGLRVCRLKIKRTTAGTDANLWWNPLGDANGTNQGVPLFMLVAADERPQDGCPLSDWVMAASEKWTFVADVLEGAADFELELVFEAEWLC